MEKKWIATFRPGCPPIVEDALNHFADTLPAMEQVSMGELADMVEKNTGYDCITASSSVHVLDKITRLSIAKLQWKAVPFTTPADFADAVEKLMGQAPDTLQVICYVADVEVNERELIYKASHGVAAVALFELIDQYPELLADVRNIVNNWEGYQAKLTQLKEQTA